MLQKERAILTNSLPGERTYVRTCTENHHSAHRCVVGWYTKYQFASHFTHKTRSVDVCARMYANVCVAIRSISLVFLHTPLIVALHVLTTKKWDSRWSDLWIKRNIYFVDMNHCEDFIFAAHWVLKKWINQTKLELCTYLREPSIPKIPVQCKLQVVARRVLSKEQ